MAGPNIPGDTGNRLAFLLGLLPSKHNQPVTRHKPSMTAVHMGQEESTR